MESINLLDYETRKKAMKQIRIKPENEPEMSEFDSAFLCGLLEKHQPKKIVEIGVAAGGTTAIILKKLEECEDPVEMYSCDYSRKYYRKVRVNGQYRETGFMAHEIRAKSKVKHEFLLGEWFPKYIKQVGNDVDFLILDTVHFLPGEVLDFLAILPSLSNNAVVVLHDISYNLGRKYAIDGMATNALYTAVVAKKILNFIIEENNAYPNIGAFQINDDTTRYIENIFGVLMLKWTYIPSRNEWNLYRNLYSKTYDKKMIHLFDEAYRLHLHLMGEKTPWRDRIKNSAKIILKG